MSMNITDFCDKYGIKYFGISLKIGKGKNGKTYKFPKHHQLTGQPDQNDFYNLTAQELERRRQNTDLFDYLVMDTSTFIHIDVDYEDGEDYPKDEMDFIEAYTERTAYFKSVTKMRGKHLIIKTNETFNNNRRPQSKLEGVEFLNGQWSYVKRDTKVYNADKIYELDEDDILELYDASKNVKKMMDNKNVDPSIKSKLKSTIQTLKEI